MKLKRASIARVRRRASAAGVEGGRDTLLAEACARSWLLDRGVPCWTDPSPPGRAGRYGLVFRSGRRALVIPLEGSASAFTFDSMMKAGCEYLITVEIDPPGSGSPLGYLLWRDIPRDGGISCRLSAGEVSPRSMSGFPELLRRPAHYRISSIAGALSLLVRGDREPPPPSDPEDRELGSGFTPA